MKKITQQLGLITLAGLLSACGTTRIATESTVRMPEQFEQTQTVGGSTEIARWWQNWRDPQLNGLIEQALRQNLDIAAAQARLQEAQAVARYSEAELGPNVGAQGNLYGIRSGSNRQLPNADAANSANLQTVSLKASWELDLFGKKQSDADAAQAAAMSAQDQIYATQMAISGQLAEHYFNIHALQQQSTILKQSENTLQRLKRYVQGRFNAGQANANDVLEAESRISAVQAQQATLNAQADAERRAIAVLLGKTPQGFHIDKSAVDLLRVLPEPPQGAMPGDILQRRPDLRAYRNQIQAQAAKLASAKADLYPRFDIQFLGQSGRIKLNGDSPALKGWAGLISTGISVPIFTNGRIRANIDMADARLQNALLQYDKALLQALADVDNSYQAQYALKRRTDLLQTAAHQAQSRADNADKLFRHGEKTLDNALTARLTAQDYRLQLLETRLNGAKNLINLYRALGGGWTE